jgi:hypothetical protein
MCCAALLLLPRCKPGSTCRQSCPAAPVWRNNRLDSSALSLGPKTVGDAGTRMSNIVVNWICFYFFEVNCFLFLKYGPVACCVTFSPTPADTAQRNTGLIHSLLCLLPLIHITA